MITVGIDLAADEKKTGVATIEWRAGNATITDVVVGASNESLIEFIAGADKTGIDCPLGWPQKFIDFIVAHQDGHVEIEPGVLAADWRRALSYRATDLWLKQQVKGVQGLSVSSDRIGVTTMRCAALMSSLSGLGRAVDRTGVGEVVEVYPAASLARWGFSHRGYKGAKGAVGRSALVDQLKATQRWLDFGAFEAECRRTDDALDAVVAAMTARAAAMGQVEPIPEDQREAADHEGWIALPNSSLGHLAP